MMLIKDQHEQMLLTWLRQVRSEARAHHCSSKMNSDELRNTGIRKVKG